MNPRNLLPAGLASRVQRRRALRRWSRIIGGYALVLTLTGFGIAFTGDAPEAPSNAANAGPSITSLNVKLAALRKQSAAVRDEWQSADSLAKRPDWSVLLARLPEALGDNAVLTEVTLEPRSATRSLRLSGMARSAGDVTGLVLRIEQLQFFEQVQLVNSAPQDFRGRSATGFTLLCKLPAGEGAAK